MLGDSNQRLTVQNLCSSKDSWAHDEDVHDVEYVEQPGANMTNKSYCCLFPKYQFSICTLSLFDLIDTKHYPKAMHKMYPWEKYDHVSRLQMLKDGLFREYYFGRDFPDVVFAGPLLWDYVSYARHQIAESTSDQLEASYTLSQIDFVTRICQLSPHSLCDEGRLVWHTTHEDKVFKGPALVALNTRATSVARSLHMSVFDHASVFPKGNSWYSTDHHFKPVAYRAYFDFVLLFLGCLGPLKTHPQ